MVYTVDRTWFTFPVHTTVEAQAIAAVGCSHMASKITYNSGNEKYF